MGVRIAARGIKIKGSSHSMSRAATAPHSSADTRRSFRAANSPPLSLTSVSSAAAAMGVRLPSHEVGLVAGDSECYEMFPSLFDARIHPVTAAPVVSHQDFVEYLLAKRYASGGAVRHAILPFAGRNQCVWGCLLYTSPSPRDRG